MTKNLLRLVLTFSFISLINISAMSQDILGGQVRGSFQVDVQTYEPNSQIGITEEDINGNKAGMNGFGTFIYTNQNFTMGMRFESYLKPLVGFDRQYEGSGIPYRFASYRKDKFEVTVGNFYDQFGNGLIFRAYEEWTLGYDNSVDGIRVKFKPSEGISIKGIYGVQRLYWEKYSNGNRGIVRGADGEFFLNDIFHGMAENKTKIMIGGAFMNKYQKDDPFFPYNLPENVSAFSGRFNLSTGKFSLLGEYAYKINDPNAINNNIYKPGEAIFLSGSFSQKGLGITIGTKWIDNMSYKSDRTNKGNALDLSFLPPLTKIHTYSLEAMYPYATQPNGEMASNLQIVYTIPKKSKLGGKYGTTLEFNYTKTTAINKTAINDTTPIGAEGTLGYNSTFFGAGDLTYFDDINVEITKKFNKKWKMILAYTYLNYNFDVIEEGIESDHNIFKVHVGVADITYKFDRRNALRLELQYLNTKQDSGNWVAALLEYSIAPKWFFSVRDEYNFNNPVSSNTYHYYSAAFGFTNGPNRIQMAYGLQREGILCVGGVCRRVPAASGLTLTIVSSF
jgi:hypothetical protein